MKHHETETEAVAEVESAIVDARTNGNWMVAVWSHCDGKVTLHTRTTHRFPQGDFLNAAYLLTKTMVEEVEPKDDFPSPLPRANLRIANPNLLRSEPSP